MRPFDPRILRLAPRARAPIATLAALSAATGVTAIGLAFAVAALVVAMVRGTSLSGPVVAVGILFGARAALTAATEVVAAWAGTRVSTQARRRLLGTWLSRTVDERPAPGTALTLATQGCASIEPYVARYLPALVSAAVLPPLAIVAMALLDPLSALIAVVTVPLLPLFAALIGRTTADETRLRWRSMAALSGHFLDVMRGLPTLVAYGRAENQARTIDDVSQQHRRSTMQTLRLAFLSSAALELLATISVALVAVTVGIRLAAGNLDLGTGLTVILLAPEAYWPIRRMGAEFHSAADGAEALSAVCDVLATDSAGAPPVGTAPDTQANVSETHLSRRTIGGSLRLRGVGYTYPGATAPALVGVEGDFGVGLTLLTGPSGAGKTTLLELVAGLRLPTEGTIEAPPAHLVTQRPFLAAGTIRDNLALGAAHGVDDSTPGLWDALRRVGMDGVVAALPEGLDATLGDDGAGLSAGQRSRLAMARLLLCDAPLLLLDEPTAHLDPVSADVVHRLVRDLSTTHVVVVVTHRPELIAQADQVVELAGRLTPVGG